jgi:serine/threonine-protein kinase RsbW
LNDSQKISLNTISVKSTTDNLAMIREFTRSAAENCGFSEDIIGKIILAVDEACTNIIKHAYKFSADGEIILTVSCKDSRFSIRIVDNGFTFDHNRIPEPDLKEYYKQKRVGGLGVYLIKKLMDEVNYSKISGNANQIELVKYLTR